MNFSGRLKQKKGKLSSSADETKKFVEFWDSVTAAKLNMEGEFTSLSTESLVVHPTRNYLETSSSVFIDNEMGRTSSAGLQAFLNDGNYKFFFKRRGPSFHYLTSMMTYKLNINY